MTEDTLAALLATHPPLEEHYERWLHDAPVETEQLHRDADAATVAAHRHYAATVPVYRTLAEQLDLSDCKDAEEIRAEMSSGDELFKSYEAKLVEDGDFEAMTDWLGKLSTTRPRPVLTEVTDVAAWLDALGEVGLSVRFSSGTSGQLSFVPREAACEAALLTHTRSQWRHMLGVEPLDLGRFESFFLAFRGGRQAFSSQGFLLSTLTASATFLFEEPADPELVRLSVVGAVRPADVGRLEAFRQRTAGSLDSHYERVISRLSDAAAAGRPTFVYAPPFQLLDLCERMEAADLRLPAQPASVLLTGGGWKSFEHQRIAREELLGRARERLGITAAHIQEGYGQTECNVHFHRCQEGRFHIPPLVTPMVLDESLYPIDGGGTGRYAFSDPFATSYPGFVTTGDEVELTDDPCPCGRWGWAIVGEIRRAQGTGVKGCAGVMAATRA